MESMKIGPNFDDFNQVVETFIWKSDEKYEKFQNKYA